MNFIMKNEHKIIHLKFVRFGANAKEWVRKCELLLPEIYKYRIWEQKGFSSIYEYAAKLAGMSREKVNETLRILGKIEKLPALLLVAAEKGIGAVKPVATIASAETANFWAEKAKMMSKHTLETYIKEMRLQGEIGRPGTAKSDVDPQQQAIENFSGHEDTGEGGFGEGCHAGREPAGAGRESAGAGRESTGGHSEPAENRYSEPGYRTQKKIVVMELESEIAGQLEKLKGDGDWNELVKQLLKIREQKLEQEKPAAVKSRSRYIPAKIRHFVINKTNGRCAFPNCGKKIDILHHTQRFALEKIHDPERLTGLCKNHERLAHAGLIYGEEESPEKWRVGARSDKSAATYKIDRLVARYRTRDAYLVKI
jgi:hypothetical protein